MIKIEEIQRPRKKGRPSDEDWRCVNGHDRCDQMYPGPECPYCERRVKKGRPRIEDIDKSLEATKPWLALKMSRTTWYRRQAEKRVAANHL